MAALSTSVEEVRTAQLQSKRSRRRYKELVSRHLHAAPAKLEALIGGICRYVGPRPDGIQRHISNFTVQILNPPGTKGAAGQNGNKKPQQQHVHLNLLTSHYQIP